MPDSPKRDLAPKTGANSAPHAAKVRGLNNSALGHVFAGRSSESCGRLSAKKMRQTRLASGRLPRPKALFSPFGVLYDSALPNTPGRQ